MSAAALDGLHVTNGLLEAVFFFYFPFKWMGRASNACAYSFNQSSPRDGRVWEEAGRAELEVSKAFHFLYCTSLITAERF